MNKKNLDSFSKRLKIKLEKHKLKLEKILQTVNVKSVLNSLNKEQIRNVLELLFLVLSHKVAIPLKLKYVSSDYTDSLRTISKKFATESQFKHTLALPLSGIIHLLYRHQNLLKKILSFVFE